MTRQEMLIETDMLQGNLNRMCVTKDAEELERMYETARRRLEKIYEFNKNRTQKIPAENPQG